MAQSSVRRQGFIDKEKTARAAYAGTAMLVLRQFQGLLVAAVLGVAIYAGYVVAGLAAAPAVSGTVRGLPLDAPVAILRDARDIPHIRARTEHDLFFAQGYAEASDRLFQMDLIRRFIYGRLAEILGPLQLPIDERNRFLDAREIASREWQALGTRDRNDLQAFSDGVNAAMGRQPLPVEFRLLLYQPQAWTPRDSLAVLLAVCASVSDWPGEIIERDRFWRRLGPRRFEQWFPLSDGEYEGSKSHVPGSNAWAAGAQLTRSGHALIANDPHLDLYLPGIWYLVDLRAPRIHAAGATVPGVPGVLLGHNERVAWATTNALAATLSLFRARHLPNRYWEPETFGVRFGRSVVLPYYRDPRAFGFSETPGGKNALLVRWQPYFDRRTALTTILDLDGAQSARAALRTLSSYAGPPQNFVVADDRGEVAYHLAGAIPNDPAWGRYVHADTTELNRIAPLAYAQLPAIAPSRDGVVISANNKMYGGGYPYRLSARFAPPYRAERIARLLQTSKPYEIAGFARMQMDAFSAIDREFARRIAAYARSHAGILPDRDVRALASWNGEFTGSSHAATLVHDLRVNAIDGADAPYAVLDDLRHGRFGEALVDNLRGTVNSAQGEPLDRPWSSAGAVQVAHPLGLLGFPFLNGPTLPGLGDENTLHVQSPGFAQSFRAVWEAGNWNSGGIVIPGGESGYPGSGHYTDLTRAWIAGKVAPLPFSEAAIRAATRHTLKLLP